MKKFIMFLLFVYSRNLLSSVDNFDSERVKSHDCKNQQKECICQESWVIQYYLEKKKALIDTVEKVPQKAKEVVANAIVKIEDIFTIVKKSLGYGVNQISETVNDIRNWAYEHKTEDNTKK